MPSFTKQKISCILSEAPLYILFLHRERDQGHKDWQPESQALES